MAVFGYTLFYLLFVVLSLREATATGRRRSTPEALNEWEQQAKAPAGSQITIEIVLAQSNIELGESSLLDISDPSSPRYGVYWTAEEVARLFAPSAENIQPIMDWLNNSGISPTRIFRSPVWGCMLVNVTVMEAESLLGTTFYYFLNRIFGEIRVACTGYRVPTELTSLIDYVITTSPYMAIPGFIETTEKAKTQVNQTRQSYNRTLLTAAADCSKYTTPACLRAIYNIANGTAQHPENSFGIYERAWATWLPEDLDLFFETFQPDLVGQRPHVARIDGGYMQTHLKMMPFNLEPNLDFEYAMALTSPQVVTNIQVGDMNHGGNFNNMLAAFDKFYCGMIDPSFDPTFPDLLPGGYNSTDCGTVSPPKVLSISYGESEASFPAEYLQRQCLEYLKLGLMGITIIVASGDSGVKSGLQPGTCINPNTAAANVTTGLFSPGWPAACPWVTSVGGTQQIARPSKRSNTGENTGSPGFFTNDPTNETVFNKLLSGATFSSGGGFSNVFPVPPYQLRAVAEYRSRELDHLQHLEGLYNSGGRGFPDISALASRYLVASDGQLRSVYGTSASAPVFASMISMINNERLHAGKTTVGFINTALYAYPEILNDVTTGSNEGCGFDPAFRATKDWDPVTGLGSPDYGRLRELFMSFN